MTHAEKITAAARAIRKGCFDGQYEGNGDFVLSQESIVGIITRHLGYGSEVPTEPGWYWCSWPGDDKDEWATVEAVFKHQDGELCVSGMRDDVKTLVMRGYRFAGPIAQP